MTNNRLLLKAGAIALVALLAFACVVPPLPPPVYDPDEVVDTGSDPDDLGLHVTVAAYNVEGFDLGGETPAGTCDGIAKALKNASVEIAAFSEVQPEDIDLLRAAFSANAYDLNHIVYSSKSDGYNSFAVASSYPILSSTEILSPSSGTWPRIVYQVRLDVGQGLALYVCHLKSGSDADSLAKRKAQAAALAEYLRDSYGVAISTASIIVLGDMNTMSDGDRSGSGNTLDALELQNDAVASNDFISLTEALLAPAEAYTWEGWVSSVWTQSALDHLVLSPGAYARYVPDSLRIWRLDPSVTMLANSDHYPVLLDISL